MLQLFENELVSSISFNQTEILRWIERLHVKRFQTDVTYNIGGFWKGIDRPKLCYDLTPKFSFVRKADYRDLPHADGELTNIVWDPPFVCGTHIESEPYAPGDRYTMFRNYEGLKSNYEQAITEFDRVLKPGGYLIAKCQDIVSGRSNRFSHVLIHNLAEQAGFRAVDLFVLLAKNRFIGSGEQYHARKFHCYFWVFRKKRWS